MAPPSLASVPSYTSRAAGVFAVLRLLTILISDVRGFDITGVTTEIDLIFPQIKDLCSCIQACLDRKATCNNYVWKFSDAESVKIGHRTCTLCYHRFLGAVNYRLQFYPAS